MNDLVPRVPRVPGLPLLGNGIGILVDPCKFFHHAYQTCGPVFEVRYPGRTLKVLAGQQANALLADGGPFDMASTYARVTREVGSKQLPNAVDGAAHKTLRRCMAPSLSVHGLEPHVPALHETVARHLAGWEGRRGGSVAFCEPLATDLVCGSSFGSGPTPGMTTDVARYGTIMGAVGVGAAGPEWLLYTPWVRASRRRLDAYVAQLVADHRLPRGERPPDLLDALIAAATRGSIDPSTVVALALLPLKNAGIYLARFISFAIFAAVSDPVLRAELTAEVDSSWVGGPPSLDVLRRCRLLQGHLLETLRFWPMAIVLPRIVGQAFEFAGHRMEVGERVYFAGPVTHFLDDCFADPTRFDPRRYSPERSEHRRPHAYAPFGLGAHACMARSFSLSLGAIALAGVLRHGGLTRRGQGPLRVWSAPSPVPEARFRIDVAAPRAVPSVTVALGDDVPLPGGLLLDGVTMRRFADGEVVFEENDEADAFYVIRDGGAVVERGGVQVARLKVGQSFGEMGLLQDLPRNATIRAAGTLRTAVIDRATFHRLAVEGELTHNELLRIMEHRGQLNVLASVLPGFDVSQVPRDGLRFTHVLRGAEVVSQGDVADRLYVLIEGQVSVWVASPGQAPIQVATLKGLDLFGEIGLIDGGIRMATVLAETPLKLMEVDAPTFARLIAGADLRRGLGAVAAERLAALLAGGT